MCFKALQLWKQRSCLGEMPPFSSLCLAIILLMISSWRSCIVHAQHQNLSSKFMHLSPGLNLSILPSYSLPSGHPKSYDSMFAVGIPNIHGGLFFPILSSPRFFNESSTNQTLGFSLGLYGWPCSEVVCTLYLALCTGSPGNTTHGLLQSGPFFPASPAGVKLHPYYTINGLVVPLWMANRENPITNAGDASLVVVAAPHNNSGDDNTIMGPELQLRDGNRVVWNVRNAAMMGMSDSGEFRVYNPANATVFKAARSATTDTLFEGQRMTAGMELTSADSAYTARMEKGGLALYMNGMGAQAPPYLIFPLLRDPPLQSSRRGAAPSMNELISSAPCRNASYSGYIQVVTEKSGRSLDFFVEPQSCRQTFSNQYFYNFPTTLEGMLAWSFLRLETDGRLYIYSVTGSSSNPLRSPLKAAVDCKDSLSQTFVRLPDSAGGTINQSVTKPTSMITSNTILQADASGVVPFCDVPLACGPLGVCTPGRVEAPCRCPDESLFEPIQATDLKQGCQPRTSLQPLCSSSTQLPVIHTTFIELQSTANVFLFIDGWTLMNSTQDDVDTCKQACASDCSCHGLSYQFSTSSCFLIQHNINLVSVLDSNITIWNYTATSIQGLPLSKQIYAHDYVTHLKVAAPPPGDNSSAFPLIGLIGIIPVCVSFFIGLGAILYHRMKRRRKLVLQRAKEEEEQAKEEEELREVLPMLPSRFSYRQLDEATKSFSKLLGAGGCGSVYAGVLPDGRKVAVKVLEGTLIRQGSARQCREFLAEVATIGRTGHHNIVRLVGFCWQASHRMLVYEYLERGSLDRWLFKLEGPIEGHKMLLDWNKRYQIALGIARGLHYLHEGCEQAILHFDIKPQNILLDDAFVAKISDFGMSRLMQRDMSAVMTGLRGTPGYIAPEWLSHATVSKKSDVYSMGIMMLEIVAGRRVLERSLSNSPSSSSEQEAWYLPSWVAKKMDQGMLMDIMDKRLSLSGSDDVQVQRLLYIALWCIHEDPAMRPHASTVVQWLENMDFPIQCPPPMFTSTMTTSILKDDAQAAPSSSSSSMFWGLIAHSV